MALGLPNRTHPGARFGVALVVLGVAAVTATAGPTSGYGYRPIHVPVLTVGAAVLVTVTLTGALFLRRGAGAWAAFLLLPATVLLLTDPLARAVTDFAGSW